MNIIKHLTLFTILLSTMTFAEHELTCYERDYRQEVNEGKRSKILQHQLLEKVVV